MDRLPWEATDSCWLVQGPVRLNIEAFVPEKLPKPDIGALRSMCVLQVIVQPNDSVLEVSIFVNRTRVSRHKQFPATISLELLQSSLHQASLQMSVNNEGISTNIPLPPIPQSQSAICYPTFHHSYPSGLTLSLTWIHPPQRFTLSRIPAANDRTNALILSLDLNEHREENPRNLRRHSIEKSLDDLIDQYLKKCVNATQSVSKISKHLVEPHIALGVIASRWIGDFLAGLSPMKLLLGEISDAVRVHAILADPCPQQGVNSFLVIELLDLESSILHALKSKPLSADTEAFLDLPSEGELLRITLIQEEIDSVVSPTRSRQFSPSMKPGSRMWKRQEIDSIEITVREIRQPVIHIRLNCTPVVKIKINFRRTPRNVAWINEICPILNGFPDILHDFIFQFIHRNRHHYALGLVTTLGGSTTTIFHFLRATEIFFARPTQSAKQAFDGLCSIPTLTHPTLLSMQVPWLSIDEIIRFNSCGDHQKTFILYSFLQNSSETKRRPHLVLCQMQLSEIELAIVDSQSIWSVQRKKSWAINDQSCPIKYVLTVVTESNIYLLNPRTLVSTLLHFSPVEHARDRLFNENDTAVQDFLIKRLTEIPPSVLRFG